jgi:hypothetical protein
MLSVILAVVALCTTLPDTWIRVFDSPDHDAVFGAVLTGPANAIVVGATSYRHVPPFSGDALIMNVDLSNGTVLRERT